MGGVYDIFTSCKHPAPNLALTTLTATKTDCTVIDRRDLDPGMNLGFLVFVPTVTTADGSNYFEFLLKEADEKTSATALTSGTAVAAADVLGLTKDGTVLDPTTAPSYPFIRINATTMAGTVWWFQYRGVKNCVQIVPTETGTSSIAAAVLLALWNGHTQNVEAPVIS